jgi:L-ascorbate metabolism protein UlaG (beta-lactamase superfamily)
MGLTIEWLGHCAFRLKRDDGFGVLVDPFDDTIGYRVPHYRCDILLVTHRHYDTQAVHLVEPGYTMLREPGVKRIRGIDFDGIPWWHDNKLGRDYGQVLIYKFTMDGIRFAYLSHIGTIPDPDILDRLGRVDVLFLPIGGMFALGPGDARQMVTLLNPRLIIPMHYKTPSLRFELLPLSDFTRLMPTIHSVLDWKVRIDPGMLPDSPIVLAMQYWSSQSLS